MIEKERWPRYAKYICLTGNLAIGFLILCLVVLFASYIPITLNNQSYMIGECKIVKGKVFQNRCLGRICWNAYIGITAINDIVDYIFIDTYFNQTEADFASVKNIGLLVYPCYYKDQGRTIILELTSTLATYIAGLVFITLSIIFSVITLISAWIKYELRTWFMKLFTDCKCCLSRRRHYENMADLGDDKIFL
jgi:hypothetical protein